MKNFSSRTKVNSPRSSRKGTLFRVLSLVVVAVVVLYFFRALLGGGVAFLSAPLYDLRNWFLESSATVPSYFRDRSVLIDRINTLKEKNATLTNRESSFSKLVDENNTLRELFSMEHPDRIGAGILGRPPAMPYDALFIDRGAADGVSEGAIVYQKNNTAIGFVAKAYQGSALVTLFTSPGILTTVYVLGPDIYTRAYGEGGGVLRVSVPQGIPIEKGDVVVLPSLTSGLLGRIHTIESIDTRPEQTGYVSYDTPIQSMQFVSVSRKVPEHTSFEEAERVVEAAHNEYLTIDVPDEIIVGSSTEDGTGTSSEDRSSVAGGASQNSGAEDIITTE